MSNSRPGPWKILPKSSKKVMAYTFGLLIAIAAVVMTVTVALGTSNNAQPSSLTTQNAPVATVNTVHAHTAS